jgi:hypothetical protein
MTQEEIIEMARQAGFRVGPSRDGPDDVWGVVANLDRLAKLIAEKEREACAKVCDDHWEKGGAAYYCALTIRYRGQA